jgi:hypothetical protein
VDVFSRVVHTHAASPQPPSEELYLISHLREIRAPAACLNFVSICLRIDPQKRAKASELRLHSWLTTMIWAVLSGRLQEALDWNCIVGELVSGEMDLVNGADAVGFDLDHTLIRCCCSAQAMWWYTCKSLMRCSLWIVVVVVKVQRAGRVCAHLPGGERMAARVDGDSLCTLCSDRTAAVRSCVCRQGAALLSTALGVMMMMVFDSMMSSWVSIVAIVTIIRHCRDYHGFRDCHDSMMSSWVSIVAIVMIIVIAAIIMTHHCHPGHQHHSSTCIASTVGVYCMHGSPMLLTPACSGYCVGQAAR